MSFINELSLFIGIWVAIYGLDAWRREHVGKRQIELAEDTLALFYEAEDVIKHIRHPMSYAHEREDVEKSESETDAQFSARKNASVVFHRYNKHNELFNKLHASRYRFMAQIGVEKAKPFDELRQIVNKVVLSARTLSRLWAREHFHNDSDWTRHLEQIQKHEAIFWEGTIEDDPINPLVRDVIFDIEETCRAIISADRSCDFLGIKKFYKKYKKSHI